MVERRRGCTYLGGHGRAAPTLLDLLGIFGGGSGTSRYGDLTSVEVVALRSPRSATTPRATAPLAAVPSVPRALRPLAPVALSLHCDRGPPSSAPDFGCVAASSPCPPPPASFTGSLPSVCAFHAAAAAAESLEPLGDDVLGAVAAVSSASTPTSRRPPPPSFWTPASRHPSVSSSTAGAPADTVLAVNGEGDEDDDNGVSGDLVPWTSRRPFVRLRLLVILVIAFTVVGFVVLSPLFHCYM